MVLLCALGALGGEKLLDTARRGSRICIHSHLTLIALLVIAWLPGAVIFRLPIADRDKRAGLDAEERLFWAVIISAVVSLSVVLGLAVAHRYSFERLLIANLGLALAAAAAGRFRLRLGTEGAAGPVSAPCCRLRFCCSARGATFRRPSTSSAAKIPASTSMRASRSPSADRS